jgi:hypothetical protein
LANDVGDAGNSNRLNLRRERQLEGIADAKARGVYQGRKASIDPAKVKAFIARLLKGLRPAALATVPLAGMVPSRGVLPGFRLQKAAAESASACRGSEGEALLLEQCSGLVMQFCRG